MTDIYCNSKTSDMDLQECYQETNKWLKDFEYLNIERKFLRKIIKDYVTDSGLVSRGIVDQFNKQLFELEIALHTLRDDVLSNQTKIDLSIRGIVTGGKKDIKSQQIKLLERVNDLFSSFKKFKQELFGAVRRVIEEEALD